jgi:hypothetical protein
MITHFKTILILLLLLLYIIFIPYNIGLYLVKLIKTFPLIPFELNLPTLSFYGTLLCFLICIYYVIYYIIKSK